MSPAIKPTPELNRRRKAFGALVARALDAARQRGMTIREIEEATGIGSTTFYGWRDGRWVRDPSATLVNNFCDGVGLTRAEAYRALEWETQSRPTRKAPEPITDDPLLRRLSQKLASPNTSAAEKLMMRRLIRSLTEDFKEDDET